MNFDVKDLTSEIRDLKMKKVKTYVTIVKNVNKKLVNQLNETERQWWVNVQ